MKTSLLLFALAFVAFNVWGCSEDTPANNNTSTNSFSVGSTTYNNLLVTCNAVSGGYTINAGDMNGSGSSCSFAFSGGTPGAGTYTLGVAGNVTVTAISGGISYAGETGSVVVTLNNGKVKVSCTNLNLTKVADPSQTATLTVSVQCGS